MQFAPHTAEDIQGMLETVLPRHPGRTAGEEGLEALFAHIPTQLRISEALDLPAGRSEDPVTRRLSELAAGNEVDAVCFAGGGSYDHYVPAVVPTIISRGEFLTAYTPYQPEVSQGMLQALFEYQTVISEVTGLPVSNASLYDGASATAEATSMACAASRRGRVLVSGALDAPTRQVVRTYAEPLSRRIEEVPPDPGSGRTPSPSDELFAGDEVAAVVVGQPNALGVVEDLRGLADAAHDAGAQLIVKFDPTAAGLLATPGSLGADIVVGEGQSLGQGLRFGGPTFGFLACTDAQVRRVPGRLIGETIDAEGVRGYVMTLRPREQDIRRERATSNVCTNQTLNAVAGLVHLTWLGPQGLAELAHSCLSRARHAIACLTEIEGVELAVDGPTYKEFPLRLDVDDPHALVTALHGEGYLIGPVVPDGPAAGAVMVAITERRTRREVEGLAEALGRLVKEA